MLKRMNYALSFLILVMLLIVSPASAQESGKQAEQTDSIKQLAEKVERLQALVEQQQRLLAEMEKRLNSNEVKAQAAELRSPQQLKPADAALKTKPPEGEISLSDRQAASGSSPTQTESKSSPVAGWDRGRFFLRSADGNFEGTITGYGQLDYRGYQDGNHPPNTFLVRRARLAFEGKLQRYYDFRVEGDFADIAGTALRDFYVRIHRIDELQLSFGQFRVPISQEEIRSDAVQDFVERSLVNNLVPSRSPGIMASGVINKGVFEYQVGSFNGKGLLGLNNNGTPESALRLRFSPWRNTKSFWGKGLSFGGAYTQGRNIGGLGFRGQTESRSITFYVPDIVSGKLIRANGELTWMLGPAAFRTEYVQTNQERENLGAGGTTLPGVVGKGYMAQFTYLLTGEDKPEAGAITPKKILFGDGTGEAGFGAWELKVRYADLQISNGTAKSNRGQTVFFGVNWYLNRHVRHLLDFGFERFNDPLRSPKPGDDNFFVVLSRVQVAF